MNQNLNGKIQPVKKHYKDGIKLKSALKNESLQSQFEYMILNDVTLI